MVNETENPSLALQECLAFILNSDDQARGPDGRWVSGGGDGSHDDMISKAIGKGSSKFGKFKSKHGSVTVTSDEDTGTLTLKADKGSTKDLHINDPSDVKPQKVGKKIEVDEDSIVIRGDPAARAISIFDPPSVRNMDPRTWWQKFAAFITNTPQHPVNGKFHPEKDMTQAHAFKAWGEATGQALVESQKEEEENAAKYKRFAESARKNGDEEAAQEWERIALEEEEHADTFEGLLAKTYNAFCATGKDGGIDPSCEGGSSGGNTEPSKAASTYAKIKDNIGSDSVTYASIEKDIDEATAGMTVKQIKGLYEEIGRTPPPHAKGKDGLIKSLKITLKDLRENYHRNKTTNTFADEIKRIYNRQETFEDVVKQTYQGQLQEI